MSCVKLGWSHHKHLPLESRFLMLASLFIISANRLPAYLFFPFENPTYQGVCYLFFSLYCAVILQRRCAHRRTICPEQLWPGGGRTAAGRPRISDAPRAKLLTVKTM